MVFTGWSALRRMNCSCASVGEKFIEFFSRSAKRETRGKFALGFAACSKRPFDHKYFAIGTALGEEI
jgi:hypothetical protein